MNIFRLFSKSKKPEGGLLPPISEDHKMQLLEKMLEIAVSEGMKPEDMRFWEINND